MMDQYYQHQSSAASSHSSSPSSSNSSSYGRRRTPYRFSFLAHLAVFSRIALPSVFSSKISSYLSFSIILSQRWQRVARGQCWGGGKSGSRPILRACQTAPGMMRYRMGQLISRQGLALHSMRQGLNLLLMQKSSPQSSKLWCLRCGSMNWKAARSILVVISFILLSMASSWQCLWGCAESRQRWNWLQESLLAASYLPYRSPFFWMASLVRWIISSMSSRSYFSLLVRMQPSRYQQPRRLPLWQVTSRQCRMSNFLPLYRNGFMYSWTIRGRSSGPRERYLFSRAIRAAVQTILMPLPRLVFSPGFTIHTFLEALCCSMKALTQRALSMLTVLGRTVKGSISSISEQYQETTLKRMRFAPMMQFTGMWLVTLVMGASGKQETLPQSLLSYHSFATLIQERYMIFYCSSQAEFASNFVLLGGFRRVLASLGSIDVCCQWISLLVCCVQEKEKSLPEVISSQNLRFRRLLTSKPLLPVPTFTLQAIFGCESDRSTYILLEKLSLYRNSTQEVIFFQYTVSAPFCERLKRMAYRLLASLMEPYSISLRLWGLFLDISVILLCFCGEEEKSLVVLLLISSMRSRTIMSQYSQSLLGRLEKGSSCCRTDTFSCFFLSSSVRKCSSEEL